jgi:peptidoglycan L-alanyl-D-glutamate endopeptidase CwlK
MNYFSSHSINQLKTCNDRLQEIMHRAIIEIDFSILCGFRNEHDQNEAFDNGYSELKWPKSNHNFYPSRAVDIAPYPINWKDTVRFVKLSKVIKRIAEELFINIKWGGDFMDKKGRPKPDMPHYELKNGSV